MLYEILLFDMLMYQIFIIKFFDTAKNVTFLNLNSIKTMT